MLVIRLFRTGKTNQPLFKIVVTDKKNPPRGGRFLEVVGNYSPITKKINFKADRIKYWMSVGAKPLPTVYNLLVSEKIIEGKKIPKHKKAKKKTETKPEGESSAPTIRPTAEKKPESIPPASETKSPAEKPLDHSTEAMPTAEALDQNPTDKVAEVKIVPEVTAETKTLEEKQAPEKPAEEKKV